MYLIQGQKSCGVNFSGIKGLTQL